jgi:dTDP-4-amino-4,6-dideoxygalactose transaminase
MADVDARIARLQLDRLEQQIDRRVSNADRWRQLLDTRGVSGVQLPPPDANVFLKCWIAPTHVGARGPHLLREALYRAGVQTENLYVPLDRRPEFAAARTVPLPMTDTVADSVFSVPVRANLDEQDWRRVEAGVAAAGRQS